MMAVHQLLARAASDRPTELAVDDGEARLSFAELESLCRRQAAGLTAAGVTAGDRVAVLARNSASYAALYFAVASLGAVLVPLNWRLAAEELAWILGDAGARVLVSEPRFESVLGGRDYLAAAVDAPWLSGGGAGQDLTGDASPAAAVLQMYTSGTSGRPKGAVLTHRNWDAMVGAWLQDMDVRPGDRFLQVTPLFHVGGALMLLANMARASSLYLLPEFDPVLAIDALRRHRITHTLMVPAMLEWLLREPAAAEAPYDDLKLVVYGAAPMPVPTLRRAAEVLGCEFLQGYGLTETAGVLLTLTAEDHRVALARNDSARLASAGRAVACSEVRLVDSEGQPAPPGALGEIVARGGNLSPGYVVTGSDGRALKDAAGPAGWFPTGDIGVADPDGYITIVDRLKDMILVGGENVYPREVERVLMGLDGIEDAAVIGVPHSVWGEEVLAFVVAPGPTESDTRRWIRACRAQLARFKCPIRIELIAELPRNAAGKLLKRNLREPYWRDKERKV